MVFNNAQLTSFFTAGGQMALPVNVRARLSSEGLTEIDDFEDFKDDQLKDAFKNMRTSIPGLVGIPQVTNAAGNIINAAVPSVPGILPCLISARCAL